MHDCPLFLVRHMIDHYASLQSSSVDQPISPEKQARCRLARRSLHRLRASCIHPDLLLCNQPTTPDACTHNATVPAPSIYTHLSINSISHEQPGATVCSSQSAQRSAKLLPRCTSQPRFAVPLHAGGSVRPAVLPVVRVVAVAGVLAHRGVLLGGALEVDVLDLRGTAQAAQLSCSTVPACSTRRALSRCAYDDQPAATTATSFTATTCNGTRS